MDLVYRGSQRQLEYDFIIAPQADPGRIRLAFHGAEAVTLGGHGELILHTAHGDLVQHPPVVYQEAAGRRELVEGRYVLLSGRRRVAHQVGFAVNRYDRRRPLIIDPVLKYSTFLGGGPGHDLGYDIAVDGTGNAYVTGETSSATFPGVNGSSIQPTNSGGYDAFVTKLNPKGTAILYSTFLGGSSVDVGRSITVDGAGNAYITGSTDSTTFPGVTGTSLQPVYGGLGDAFVTKLNPTGTAILYSTFLGGSGGEDGLSIAVDGAGNAYVTGETSSTTFPGVSGSSIQPFHAGPSFDAFVAKLNPTGTVILYSTFLGGSGDELAYGIAVDGENNAYVTGATTSTIFPGAISSSIQPANAGGYDAFVTKINPAGTAILYSTFLGGSGGEDSYGIAVDSGGNAYVAGRTSSITFPGVNGSSIQPTNAGGYDAFVTKINPTGTAILFSTFLGGSGEDWVNCITVDGAMNAYVAGRTSSTTFPGVNGSSIQPANAGGHDAFVTKIKPAGTAILFSTFLGGSGVSEWAYGIAADAMGNIYVTGQTTSGTFPGVNGNSILPNNFDFDSGFVTKLGSGLEFYTVTPCRMVDTRNAAGPLGGPALQAGATRIFVVASVCSVPSAAKALSVNVTVAQPAAAGDLRLLPGNLPTLPLVSSISFAAGQVRANNAVVLLASDGSGSIQVKTDSAGSVHFILDVNGYFE